MRIRTIKPEFWANEKLSALPEATHMLAAALLNYADDEGFFNANPELIKASLFPLREPSRSIQGMLHDLSMIDYIRLMDGSDGRKYGKVIGFVSHQVISRPKSSKIVMLVKIPDAAVMSPLPVHDETRGNGTGNREQGTGNGTGKRKKTPEAGEPPPFTSEGFSDAWRDWESHRREKGIPIGPTARKLQFQKLAEWGEVRAIAALRHSTAGSYQGVFEPIAGMRGAGGQPKKFRSPNADLNGKEW